MDKRRIALLAAAIGLLGVMAQSSIAQAQSAPAALAAGNGWVVSPTPYRFADLVRRLEAAITANKMALVNAASASEGAKAQGVTIGGNRVVGVYRNDFARRMLAASIPAGIEAPILVLSGVPVGGPPPFETLEQRLKHPPQLSLTEGIGIATKLARAVATLHRAGIIHRDIKPDNVILLKTGGLRLVDLGVARVPLLEDFPAQDIPGTASYMAPELFGGRPGDEFSDLYALGVTVYRMFTAAYPYG